MLECTDRNRDMTLIKQLKFFYRYSVSGIASFALELGVLYVCIQGFALSFYIAVPLAFVLTTTAQWIICHWWVFKRSGRKADVEYVYFFTILFSGLILTTLLVALFVQTFGLDVYIARIIASPLTGLWDFYLNARFNFRAHPFLRRH